MIPNHDFSKDLIDTLYWETETSTFFFNIFTVEYLVIYFLFFFLENLNPVE